MTVLVNDSSAPSDMDTAAYFSVAFGLVIKSDFPIRELLRWTGEGKAPVDIEILHKSGLSSASSMPGATHFMLRHAEGEPIDDLHWSEVGSFRIIGIDRIEYEALPGVPNDLVCLPLLGIVMAVLLHHRGYLVLHGSAVKLDGKASVFLGDKGAGKSTTAASLVSQGHSILTDDVVALEWSYDGPLKLWPGFGQVKLNDDASEAIDLGSAPFLDRPHKEFPKSRIDLTDGFDAASNDVSEILVLERGERMKITPLGGQAGLLALMRYAYLARFGANFFHGVQAKTLLDACGRVVGCARIGKLEVPADLSQLRGLDKFLIEQRFRLASTI